MSPRPWRRLDERELIDRRVLRVWSRTLESPRTGRARDFTVLECPDWCNIIALTPERDVVMVRQVRHGTGEVTLELPGGMVDPEDASTVAACERELLEETGYRGRDARHLGTIAPNPALQTNQCHTALVLDAARVAELAQDEGEDIEVVLVPYRDIPGLIRGGQITHSLVVVAFVWSLGLVPPT